MRKRVYLAGPISKGNVAENVRKATEIATRLISTGYAVLCPQLTCFMGYHLATSYPWPEAAAAGIAHEEWLANDLPWVAVADAVLRIPGESVGADEEVSFAEDHNIRVFFDEETLKQHIPTSDAHESTRYFMDDCDGEETILEHRRDGSTRYYKSGMSVDSAVTAEDSFLYQHQEVTEQQATNILGYHPQDRDRLAAAQERISDAAARVVEGLKDSGARQEFSTGSVRDTREGKGRFDLLPAAALRRLAVHFERGASKYGERNWEKGQPMSRYLDSGLRHLFNFLDGQRDEDHLTAAAWNILACIWTEEKVNAGELPQELQDVS